MENSNIPRILTEEGNPFIKRANQEKRYAEAIWPIPELQNKDAKVDILKHVGDKEIGQALAELAFVIHDAKENERAARRELAKSREEVREEFKAEIEALEDRLDHSLCILNDLEWERYLAFIRKHYQLHNNGKYKKDDGITIHMVGTGIGNCYELECPVCHETEDITDVSSW